MFGVVWLVALIVAFAGLLFFHLIAIRRVLKTPHLPSVWRVLVFIPPATPVACFRSGHRVLAAVWSVLLVSYIMLWTRAPQ